MVVSVGAVSCASVHIDHVNLAHFAESRKWRKSDASAYASTDSSMYMSTNPAPLEHNMRCAWNSEMQKLKSSDLRNSATQNSETQNSEPEPRPPADIVKTAEMEEILRTDFLRLNFMPKVCRIACL